MPGLNMVLLGRRLRESRKQSDLSQTALAEQMGVSHSWISEIENGKQTRLEAETIYRFCVHLGVSADYLLGLTDIGAPVREPPRSRRTKIPPKKEYDHA